MRIERHPNNPLIVPHMDARMGANINGPSLLKVPDWLPRPLGRYYLYFAHHQGTYIRLAYADELGGPWRMHEPGTLHLEQTPMQGHIASPDIHIDAAERRIRMYYHGPHASGGQKSGVAFSADGLNFVAEPVAYAKPYLRVFRYRETWYGLAMCRDSRADADRRGGRWYRSRDGIVFDEEGPRAPLEYMRHTAVLLDGDTLTVCWSQVFQSPEHILATRIRLGPDWNAWSAEGETVSLIRPEFDWEGADCPHEPSKYGWAPERVWQLRDPGLYREGDATWIFYSVAGEHGLALARVHGL